MPGWPLSLMCTDRRRIQSAHSSFSQQQNRRFIQVTYRRSISNGVGAILSVACLNTLRSRQIGRHFANDIFKGIFLNEKGCIFSQISSIFVLKGPINNIPALVQIMACRRTGDKPLSEPMVAWFTICASRLDMLSRYDVYWFPGDKRLPNHQYPLRWLNRRYCQSYHIPQHTNTAVSHNDGAFVLCIDRIKSSRWMQMIWCQIGIMAPTNTMYSHCTWTELRHPWYHGM